MKFPKERVVLHNKIKELLSQNQYMEVLKLKDEILNSETVLDDFIYSSLAKSAFLLGDFDNVVLIYSELFKRKLESFKLTYYGLLGLLANIDIYQAISFIKRSEILNEPAIKEYFIKDGANYSNILLTSKIGKYVPLTLILVNFIEGVSKEVVGNIDLDNEYILYRFFDLINMLYELGYPDDILSYLFTAFKIIFNLDT
jgi:hypothetical protein